MSKTYSTARVAPGARLRYWNDLHGTLGAPLEITACSRGEFDAVASTDDLGPLRFVETESSPAIVVHDEQHVAQTRERRFRVVLLERGRVGLRHAGHETVLEEGDFALLDDASPYRIEFTERTRALYIAISPGTMKAYMPEPARVCGLRMSTDRPLNKVASTMLCGLWTQIQRDDLPPEHRPALARSFLQVFAASYAVDHVGGVERSIAAAARRTEIKRYIETHLRSPDLGPTAIAAGLGLSKRYLRMLFAEENDSVTAYIRRRRLEECAWELAQPQWRGRSITATASEWGFRSVTHFARAFKSAYGATPSAYKHERCEATAG